MNDTAPVTGKQITPTAAALRAIKRIAPQFSANGWFEAARIIDEETGTTRSEEEFQRLRRERAEAVEHYRNATERWIKYQHMEARFHALRHENNALRKARYPKRA